MPAELIDGTLIAAQIREEAKRQAQTLREKGSVPCLAVVLCGENPASLSYIAAKEKALAQAGMESRDIRLPANVSQSELLDVIGKLNADTKVHGILVQLPLPAHLNEDEVVEALAPEKDVDGFHTVSVGNMVLGRAGFIPCTPHGIMVLLRRLPITLAGSHAVVVGRSAIVGKPLAVLLAAKDSNATVTVCHTGTRDLAFHTLQADILIAATGKPGLITADMVKPGAVVIDVGVNRVADPSKKKGYRLCGDVDFEEVAKKAGYITPVPGGVGPMTIAMLLKNLIRAAEDAYGRT
jgi:methylenetetrahydrofolate dehydrogenase (NADP+)/methenyltetrahydrofolate cyclohydrolase